MLDSEYTDTDKEGTNCPLSFAWIPVLCFSFCQFSAHRVNYTLKNYLARYMLEILKVISPFTEPDCIRKSLTPGHLTFTLQLQ